LGNWFLPDLKVPEYTALPSLKSGYDWCVKKLKLVQTNALGSMAFDQILLNFWAACLRGGVK